MSDQPSKADDVDLGWSLFVAAPPSPSAPSAQPARAIEQLGALSLAAHTCGMTRRHEVDRFSSVQAAGRASASSRLFRGNYRPIASETASLHRTRGGRVTTVLAGR